MVSPRVLTSTEARTALPGLADEIERVGLAFEPVLFGSHRKPVAAIVPAELLERLEGLLEDIAIAPEVTSRLSAGEGEKSMADYAREFGLDPSTFE